MKTILMLTAVKVQNTLKRLKSCFLAIAACGAFAAAGVTLPVCEVAERAQRESAVYPGRVVPVAQVDVVPQVSGEILEVCFANGAEVKEGEYCWDLIDSTAQNWIAKGKKIAIRVICCNQTETAVPQYVRDAGAVAVFASFLWTFKRNRVSE